MVIGRRFKYQRVVLKSEYDIDIFIRFDWKLDNISDILEGVVKSVGRKLNSVEFFCSVFKAKSLLFSCLQELKKHNNRKKK